MFFNPERIISSQSLLFLIYFTQSTGTEARLGARHSSFSYITANLTHQPCYTMGYSFWHFCVASFCSFLLSTAECSHGPNCNEDNAAGLGYLTSNFTRRWCLHISFFIQTRAQCLFLVNFVPSKMSKMTQPCRPWNIRFYSPAAGPRVSACTSSTSPLLNLHTALESLQQNQR